MLRIYWPTVFIVAGDVPAVRCPLSPVVVAFLANRHQVFRIEEECQVALMVPPMVDNRTVWCMRLAYEEPAAARPLACPIVSIEYALSEWAPSRESVKGSILGAMTLQGCLSTRCLSCDLLTQRLGRRYGDSRDNFGGNARPDVGH
jgi:hypothetical protein